MFSWSPFPFLRIAAWFVLGLLIYDAGVLLPSLVKWFLPFALLIFVWAILFKYRLLSGIAGGIVIVCLAWFHLYIDDPSNESTHISNLTTWRMEGFHGEVKGNEVEKEKYFRYDFELSNLVEKDSVQKCSGLIHLYVYKSDSIRLSPGTQLYIDYFFSRIPEPKNPAEFNYSEYIKRSGIYGQAFVHDHQLKTVASSKQHMLKTLILFVRTQSRNTIQGVVSAPRESQIATALLLGIKDYLDAEVKTAYASVGAMHVLAVSGLHVGIIYLVLLFLLKPLRLLPYGGYLVFIGLILGIWMYAMITGGSPSVLRAATMFSVIALKEISVKRANIYNSLGLAALVILLFAPQYLFAVGFQLSFIAVFGIVHLYPIIYESFKVKNWLLDRIWSISSISIAAQLATFPLSMYYFNQFPVYFLISNLFVIPGATVLLVLGLCTISVGFISPELAMYPGYLLDRSIYFLNEAVFLIDQLPHSLITGLYITGPEVWICYGVIIIFFASFHYRSFSSLVLASFLLMVQLGAVGHRNWLAARQKQIVFYEIPDKTAIDFVDGKDTRLLISDYSSEELELLSFQMDPYRRTLIAGSITTDIETWEQSPLIIQEEYHSMISWEGTRILIVHQPLGKHHRIVGKLHADIVLLANDAIRNLSELPASLQAGKLLISSDYSSQLVRRLQYQGRKDDIAIHSLSKDGYWLLDLSKPQQL